MSGYAPLTRPTKLSEFQQKPVQTTTPGESARRST